VKPTLVGFKLNVLQDMCRWTLCGVWRRHRQERFGFLYGRVRRNGHIVVEQAALYRGGRRSRCSSDVNLTKMVVRRYLLGRMLGRRPLGTFHSHISSGGETAHGASPEDRRALQLDRLALIAVVVAVRPAYREPDAKSKRALVGYEKRLGCSFNIRAYLTAGPRIRLLKVKAADAPRSAAY